jgi:LSD1 subclass zinc finger protein
MPLKVECPQCHRPLQLPDSVLGKPVRCSACQGIFTAPGGAVTEPVIPALPLPPPPAPPPVREQLTAGKPAQRPVLPGESADGKPSGRTNRPVPQSGFDFQPWSFTVLVRKDLRNKLKGSFHCEVKREELRLKQGQDIDIPIPVHTAARHPGGNRFFIKIEDREVELSVNEFKLVQDRLARDLCRFLAGRGAAPKQADYAISQGMLALTLLPMGIPFLIFGMIGGPLGGAVAGGVGGGLIAGCFAIVRRDEWSKALRITLALGVSLASYSLVGLLFLLSHQTPDRSPENDRGVEERLKATEERRAAEERRIAAENDRLRRDGGDPQKDRPPADKAVKPPDDPTVLLPGEIRRIRTGAELVWQARFSPDEKTLATLGKTGICELWDRQTGKQTGSFRVSLEGHVNWFTFSPDQGKHMAGWAGQPELFLRDGSTGEIRGRMDMGDRVAPYSMCDFFPDGKTLVACSGRDIRFWTVPEGKPAGQFGHVKCEGEETCSSAQVTRDGKALLVGGGKGAGRVDRVWDLTAASPSRQLKSFTRGNIWARLTLSPNGTLALMNTTQLVELVDWKTDKAVLLKEAPVQADFSGVTLTPDDRVLVTGHVDGKVRFWEIPSGKELGSFLARTGREGSVGGLAVSADGKTLSTATGADVSLWKLDEVFPQKK